MNIAIMGCKEIKDETCIGCQRCLTAFHRREGEFERYKDDPDARIVAIFHCGGCPATSPVLRMKQLHGWITPMGETVDVLHLGTCVKNHCAYKDTLTTVVNAKAGVPVVEGTHPYIPKDIFAH
ncbi:MAG: CGGC domain-containing protein [Myxococcota bacterium]